MKRILGLLGWVGVVLVVAALVLRIRAARPQHSPEARAGRSRGDRALHAQPVARHRPIVPGAGRQVRIGERRQCRARRSRSWSAINWISARQNKRWDLTASKQFSLSDQTKQILRTLQKPVVIRLFYRSDPTFDLQRYRDQLGEYAYHSNQVTIEYIDADKEPFKAKKYEVHGVPTRRPRVRRPDRADDHDRRAGTDQRPEEAPRRQGQEDLLRAGPRRARSVRVRARGLQRRSSRRSRARTSRSRKSRWPRKARSRMTPRSWSSPARRRISLPPELDARAARSSRAAASCWLMIDPPDKAGTARADAASSPSPRSGAFSVGNDIVVDASGMGKQLMGTDASVPLGIPVQHPITEGFRLLTAIPARAVGHAGRRRRRRKVRAEGHRDRADAAGRRPTSRASSRPGSPRRDLDKGDKTGPIALVAAVSAAARRTRRPPATAPTPRNRRRAWSSSATATSRRTGAINIPGNRDLGPEHRELARAAGEPDRHPAARSRQPADHADRAAKHVHQLAHAGDRAWPAVCYGRACVVEAAVASA